MRAQVFTVDAFTDRPFAGNPAAVCVVAEPASESWMKSVAIEFNLPVTAFLWPEGATHQLRWFTATMELELCGHGTLAAAHVLAEMGRLQEGVRFQTRGGPLSAERGPHGITLDFPSRPARAQPHPELVKLLGVTPGYVGHNGMDVLVDLGSEEAVRALRPDFARVSELVPRGLIVTGQSQEQDFVSRFFAPKTGTLEDAVTGSAHCCLGPYWAERLGKSDLVGYQASSRGGFVRVGVRGERVRLTGQAVTILRGEIAV